MRGGQVSVEYIILFGIIFLITIPLFYIGLSRSRETIRVEQASDVVDSIAKVADEVYLLGLGSKDFVWINVPTGITSAYVDGKSIVINASIFGGSSEYIALSKANLTATQDFTDKLILPGRYKVKVETFLNKSTNTIVVILGGSCGDGFCSGSENTATCSADCTNVCGDGVCNYNGTGAPEACLTNYCSDCIGSQADCPVVNGTAKICDQNATSPSNGICISGTPVCGDGPCQGEPYLEDCQNCPADCQLIGNEQCCYDATTFSYYRNTVCGIPPTVTNCPDWCVYIANRDGLVPLYNNGACAQNSQQCEQLPGPGKWLQVDELDIDGNSGTPPSCGVGGVDNECDGDEYCFGGSTADHCCCVKF